MACSNTCLQVLSEQGFGNYRFVNQFSSVTVLFPTFLLDKQRPDLGLGNGYGSSVHFQ